MSYRRRIYFTSEQKSEIWDRWKSSEAMSSIGRGFDRDSSSIYPLLSRTGGIRPQLLALFAGASLRPRMALRETKSPAVELGLLDMGVTDEALLDVMLEHPILVNRPFVVTPKGIKFCRPSETVFDLLDRLPPG